MLFSPLHKLSVSNFSDLGLFLYTFFLPPCCLRRYLIDDISQNGTYSASISGQWYAVPRYELSARYDIQRRYSSICAMLISGRATLFLEPEWVEAGCSAGCSWPFADRRLRWALVHRWHGCLHLDVSGDFCLCTVATTSGRGEGECFAPLGSVIIFGVSRPSYGAASSRRCLEVADDTIADVVAIYVGVHACFLLFVTPVFTLVTVDFDILFCDVVRVCSAGHPIYPDCTFDSVLHDANNLGSKTYNSIQSQLARAKFRVTIDRWLFGGGRG